MSTLFPQMVHLGPRHYRKNPSRHMMHQDLNRSIGHLDEISCASYNPTLVEDACGENIDVIQTTDGNYHSQISIPVLFHGFIIGSKRTVLHQIETAFDCCVKMPPKMSKSRIIIVQGNTVNNVLRACERIKWISSTSRFKCRPNHFVSLPATLPNIQQKFNDFRQAILSSVNSSHHNDFSGVDPELFINPDLLHLTLTVAVLADDFEIAEAIEVLRSYVQSEEGVSIIRGGPLKLTIKGLDYMNDDPSAVHVLYAKVHDSPDKQRLQRIANAVANLFEKHGFSSSGNNRLHGDDVKLHMTLMNSKFRSITNPASKEDEAGRNSDRKPFSIIGILDSFHDFCFAQDQLFDNFTLCAMRSLTDSDRFYDTLCQVQLVQGKTPCNIVITRAIVT